MNCRLTGSSRDSGLQHHAKSKDTDPLKGASHIMLTGEGVFRAEFSFASRSVVLLAGQQVTLT